MYLVTVLYIDLGDVTIHMYLLYYIDCLGEATSSCGSQGSLLSYYTFQDGSSYVKGVDGQVFKDRMKVCYLQVYVVH